MGKMLVVFRIFPQEPEMVPMIEKELRALKDCELKDLKVEPIAFGLEAIRVAFLLPDKVEGVTDVLEKKISEIKGVNEVQVDAMTLI